MPIKSAAAREKARLRRRTEPTKARVNATAREYRRRKIVWTKSLKDVPCLDCGHKYPSECMDFDHVRGEKMFVLGGGGLYQNSMDKVLAEIAKCDVVCANCHRIRTATRAGRL